MNPDTLKDLKALDLLGKLGTNFQELPAWYKKAYHLRSKDIYAAYDVIDNTKIKDSEMFAISQFSYYSSLDLYRYILDGDWEDQTKEGYLSLFEKFYNLAQEKGYTSRQLGNLRKTYLKYG